MSLIEEITQGVRMEVRPNSQGSEYLEAVMSRGDLELLRPILAKHLGAAVKEAGQEADLPGEIRETIDALGGLRQEQSFFCKRDGRRVHFAAIWPWTSNPDKVTIKCGIMG